MSPFADGCATGTMCVAHQQRARCPRRDGGVVRRDDSGAVGVDAVEQRGDLFAGGAVSSPVGSRRAAAADSRARARRPLRFAAEICDGL
jgi:hypothetical protein